MKGTRGLGRVYGRKRGPAPAPGEPDKRRTVWWIEYWHLGKQHRESSESTVQADAGRLLKRRLREIGAGTFAPKAERVMFGDLADMLTNDYAAQGRMSLDRVERAIEHLRAFFGNDRAVDITPDRSDAYIAARLAGEVAAAVKEGSRPRSANASRATVQRELALLSRAFTLAERAGKVAHRPRLTRLVVENTRTASFTQAELDRVLDVLAHGRPATAIDQALKARPDLMPPVMFACWTGWRMQSDVFPLRWAQVDFSAGTVTRWSRGTTKAGEHVVFPFEAVPELAATLKRQREATTALEHETGSIIPTVFHRHGKPIHDFRTAWRVACSCAGVPGRVPHDLRRTAARNLRALGMSDRDIAELCGWKTTAMVARYLGRDPAGVAERLRAKLAESEASRTIPAPLALGSENRQ